MKTAVIESMTVQTMEKLQDLNLIAYKMVQELFHKRIKINPNLPRLALLSLNYPHQYVSEHEIEEWISYIEQEAVLSGRYIVLERSAIEEVLKEHSLTESDLFNTKKISQINFLGAQKIVIGKVLYQSDLYVLNLRLLDIQKASIDNSSINDKKGKKSIQPFIQETARVLYGVEKHKDKTFTNFIKYGFVPNFSLFLDKKTSAFGGSLYFFLQFPLTYHWKLDFNLGGSFKPYYFSEIPVSINNFFVDADLLIKYYPWREYFFVGLGPSLGYRVYQKILYNDTVAYSENPILFSLKKSPLDLRFKIALGAEGLDLDVFSLGFVFSALVSFDSQGEVPANKVYYQNQFHSYARKEMRVIQLEGGIIFMFGGNS